MCYMVFRLEKLFYYKGFVRWAKVASCQGLGYESDVFGDVCKVFLEVQSCVDVDSKHLVRFVWRKVFNSCSI